jgi:predicted transcriptional regulator
MVINLHIAIDKKKMDMKNRGRIEIIGQVLEAVNACSSITQLMHKAFLNHTQVKEYLQTLIDNGLLRYDLVSQRYKLTEKGETFLQIYKQIDDMINLSQLYEQEQEQQQRAWI